MAVRYRRVMNRSLELGVVLLCSALSAVVSQLAHTDSPRRSIAHRGASSYAPEHTAAAYRLAIKQGADYVEQDLAITKDGVLVCLHDETLERTTNVEELFPDRSSVDQNGRKRWLVADFTLAEIKRLDAGSWFDPKFAGERVLTWDESVDLVWGKAGMFPELKTPALYRGRGINIVTVFATAVRRRNMDVVTPAGQMPRLRVQSFDEEAVRDLAKALPNIPRTFLFGGGAPAKQWLESAETIKGLAAFTSDLGPSKDLIDRQPSLVAWAHAAGLTVTAYTFRSGSTGRFQDVASEMKFFLYDLGVDAVFTDNPDKFPRAAR
jgi:glycerophosphoryl diester phosphodiesterase